MIAYLLMGVALLLVFLVLTRLFVSANPQMLARAVRWVGITLAIVLGVLLLVRGQALIAGPKDRRAQALAAQHRGQQCHGPPSHRLL